ncbi:hypothetical protein [Phyllobacterium sp. K27]
MLSFHNRHDRPLFNAVRTDLEIHATVLSYMLAGALAFSLLLRLFLPLDKAVAVAMVYMPSLADDTKTLLLSLLWISVAFGLIRLHRTRRMARIAANTIAGTIVGSAALALGISVGLATSEAFLKSVGGAASSSWQDILVLVATAASAMLLVAVTVPMVLLIGNLPIAYYGEER